MFGFSLPKLLFTILVIAAVWYGFKMLARWQERRENADGAAAVLRRRRRRRKTAAAPSAFSRRSCQRASILKPYHTAAITRIVNSSLGRLKPNIARSVSGAAAAARRLHVSHCRRAFQRLVRAGGAIAFRPAPGAACAPRRGGASMGLRMAGAAIGAAWRRT